MDPIPGTRLDDVLIAVVVVVTALTALAAASHKWPLRSIGRWIGWVFRRLFGDPFTAWATVRLDEHVRPIVRDEIDAAITERVDPKIGHLHDCVEGVKIDVAGVKEDVAAVGAVVGQIKEKVDLRRE